MKSKTKFQKSAACKSAFYVVLPQTPFFLGYMIVMCYYKEIADILAGSDGRIVNYRTMLRIYGNGRHIHLFNFYLS